MTYTLIAHRELTSPQANIEITSIPATFTDLLLVYSLRSVRPSQLDDPVEFNFNGSSSSYTNRNLYGTGSSTISGETGNPGRIHGGFTPAAGATTNTFGNGQLYIANYRVSANKSMSIDFVHENNATTAYQTIAAGLWSVTDAISSIVIKCQIDQLASGSSATLYGITSGSSGGVVVS